MSDDKGIKVATLNIRGTDYPVHVQTYGTGAGAHANFTIPGLTTSGAYPRPITSETLEGLYKAAMATSKAKKVSIAIAVMEYRTTGYGSSKSGEMRRGTIVGRHAGNGNILVRWEGGKTEQMEGYRYAEAMFRPMTDEQAADYINLKKQEHDIDDRLSEFRARHGVGNALDKDVDTEIERVASDTPNA